MNSRLRNLCVAVAAVSLVAAGSMFAQDATFQASVDKNPVGVGEELTFSLVLSGGGMSGGNNLQLPDLSKFRMLSGPNQSSNMQWINGKTSSTVTYSYVLQPKEMGKVTIGAATIVLDGKTLQSNPIVLDVVKSAPKPKQPAAQDVNGQIADNLFVKAVVNRSRAIQGDQINLTFKLYTRLTVMNYAVEKTPTMTGFWGEDVETPKDIQLTTETINGKQYRVGIIKKMALFATQSGTLEISPMQVQTQIQVPAPRSLDPFDAFFRDPFGRTMNYTAQSEPLKITIDPLPPGAPSDFKGAVGEFAMSTTLDKRTTRTNEPVSFKVTISGTGNIKLLEAPALELPSDFEQYSPKITDNINRQGDRISGNKVFEYLLIPRYPGLKIIKPLTFSYFDLAKREYVRLRSPEVELNVEQGTALPPAIAGGTREDVRMLSQDIRFIKVGESRFRREGEFLYNAPFFIVLWVLPFAGLAGSVLYTRNRRSIIEDAAGYRNRKAIGVARKRLKVAEKLLKDLSPKAGATASTAPRFYSEVSGALWHYLGDKLSIPQAEFSVESATRSLEEHGASAEAIGALKSLLETCDLIRFAPTSIDRKEMQRTYDEASRIIVQIEQSLKFS
ncbi:MAG TPA: BatD family protein [Bacteroidota bacterium]|nr:BatD family protein [Bacteroidota bacterium]